MKEIFLRTIGFQLVLVLSLSIILRAEDLFISQSGSGNGTTCDNAKSLSWFNASTNWVQSIGSDGKIGPGDTVHLCGLFTTPAGVFPPGPLLTIQGSGIVDYPITIMFEMGAKLSAPAWGANGSIYATGKSYIVIDGNNVGVNLEATDHGTAGAINPRTNQPYQHQLSKDVTSRGIFLTNADHVIVRNFESHDMYVRTPHHPTDTHGGGTTHIVVEGFRDLLVENCKTFEGETGINVKGISLDTNNDGIKDLHARNLSVRRNIVMNCSNGIKLSARGTYDQVHDSEVIGNRIDGLDVWEGITDGGHFHSDGIQPISSQVGNLIRNLVVAYNHIGPHIGTMGQTTCHIFIEDNNSETKVFNNFLESAPGHYPVNGHIVAGRTFGYGPGEGKSYIVNNTIMGGGKGTGISWANAHVTGNIIYNVGTGLGSDIEDYQETVIDKNLFFPEPQFYIAGIGIFNSIAGWRSDVRTGFDRNSIVLDPKLNIDGSLQAGSPAIDVSLVASFFNTDYLGNGRPQGAGWDIGAYEFCQAGNCLSAPPPPPSSQIPSLSLIKNHITNQETPTEIGFIVADADTPLTNLVLSKASSNLNLVGNTGIVFGGTEANRTVTITPQTGQTGTTTITISVTDGVSIASRSFTLTVLPQGKADQSNANSEIGFLPFTNVFNPLTGPLRINLRASSLVAKLTLYDKQGSEVRTLDVSGSYVDWDGRNLSGQIVASGTYLVVLKAGDKISKKKVVVVK